MIVRGLSRAVVVAALFVLAACTQAQRQIETLQRDKPVTRVLIMPLDVQLGEMTAGGAIEWREDWTQTALGHIRPVLVTEKEKLGLKTVEFDQAKHDAGDDVDQVTRLHRAVGNSILMQKVLPLPTRGDKFDWSLGPKAAAVGQHYEADYALFVYVRDTYASGGRVALIAVGAIFGVVVPGGQQVGFASLVDLRTGSVVWFNRLARGAGDLRTAEPAGETVRLLLAEFPK